MSREIQILQTFRKACCFILLLFLFPLPWVYAQWTFLGDPLISNSAVTSQSLALSPQWVPHLAYTSAGEIFVEWFDGEDWTLMNQNGLPSNGVNGCALAFLPDGTACLALAPNLVTYSFDGLGWNLMAGLVGVTNVQGLQFRVGATGRLWLAGFKAGAVDTTVFFSKALSGNWLMHSSLEGRLLDFELDEFGDPVVLLSQATAILHYHNGIWSPLTSFDYPDEDYFALQMLYDGSGVGAMVLRRDTSNGITAEQLSFGTWSQMGTAGFATGDMADLGMSLSGIAHAVVVDHAQGGPPRAYEFVAGNWQFLGGQSVYNNTVSQPQWAFDPAAAYLVFRDDEENLRNSVVYLGTPSSAEGQVSASYLNFWPNPTTGNLNIDFAKTVPAAEIQVHDIAGRLMMQQQIRNLASFEFNVGSLPNGPYFVSLMVSGQTPLRGKVFKQ